MQVAFGIFDHMERRDVPLEQLYEQRLELLEAADRASIFCLRERKISHRGERYKFAGAPIELTPKQKPNPPFWYGASTPDGLAFAARHRMQIVTGGPNGVVKGTAIAYRELLDRFRDSPENLNPHIAEPKIGAVRHFFIADTDKQAEEIAVPAYRVYYNNIVKLWRDFGAVPTLFTDDLMRARAGDAAIVGSPNSVREKIAAYFEESGSNYLVLSFAWGGLTHEQSRHSMELFTSEVMLHFVWRMDR